MFQNDEIKPNFVAYGCFNISVIGIETFYCFQENSKPEKPMIAAVSTIIALFTTTFLNTFISEYTIRL